MIRRICLFGAVLTLFAVGLARAQHPILDMVAEKVINKYQNSTCEELWKQKSQPKSERDVRMRDDSVSAAGGRNWPPSRRFFRN